MFGSFLLSSCSDSDEPEGVDMAPQVRITLDDGQKEYVRATRRFSEGIWHAMNADAHYKDENFIFSPLALHINLAMAANGATGQTRQLFSSMILPGISEPSLDKLNELYRILIEEIPGTDIKAKYKLSNSVWHNYDVKLKEDYVKIVNGCYASPVFAYTKGSEQSKNAVNEWFANASDGGIKEYFQNPPKEDFFFLSSMLFKHAWAWKFDKSKTKQENFYCQSGKVVKVPMMHDPKSNAILVAHAKSLRAILWFGNGAFSIHLIKPDDGCTVDEAVEDLSLGEYYYNRIVDIKLPKFTLETDIDFLDILGSIGLEEALNGNGDYSEISEGSPLWWGFRQKSMMEIDEQGTVVRTSTSSGGGGMTDGAPGHLPEKEVIDFFLDHPFAFEIYEASSGAKIAMGKICEL